MKSLQLSLLAIALLMVGLSAGAASRHADLDGWIANELTPFVREQLVNHPRFKGESLRFVVLQNGKPQATSNALALRVRDRLREAAADIPGVRIAWQPDDPHYLRGSGPGGVDCTKTEVHYLVGIEMKLVEAGLLAIDVRALDVEDRSVVPGFSKAWKGPISSRQYREFSRVETDLTFRGERAAPYEESQIDLLAAHLAHDLGCTLLRQTDAEYVITQSAGVARTDSVSGMVELVSNNLAQYSTLQFSSTEDSANSVIEGKAHRIDNDLYQYWITVQPRESGSDIQALSASAYVRLPEQFAIAELLEMPPDPELHNDSNFLASLKIVELPESPTCITNRVDSRSPVYRRSLTDNRCFALAVQSTDDAVVFFLNHQLNNGLVRLADPSCMQRTSARVARSNQQLQFTLPPDTLHSAAWSAAESWQINPDLDTYYAVAASDTKAARALSQHIEQLPKRCSAPVRPGLEGAALRRWMEELTEIMNKWEPAIDWRTIRVKNIY
jgi:hypothetical protein